MTWIHCDEDGNVVSCSEDHRFNEQNCSPTMCKTFVNIYTDMTIEEARTFKGPSWLTPPSETEAGVMDEKYKCRIDLSQVVPVEDQDKIADRDVMTPLVTTAIESDQIETKPLREV
jgi:hypothetical protein